MKRCTFLCRLAPPLFHLGEVVVVVVVVKGHLAKIRRETKKIQRGEKMEEMTNMHNPTSQCFCQEAT